MTRLLITAREMTLLAALRGTLAVMAALAGELALSPSERHALVERLDAALRRP